jgi:hypothetical protein
VNELDIVLKRTCDAAPVQYEGTVNGRPFYFRARWDAWSFSIADTLDEAITASDLWIPPGGFFRESTFGTGDYAASYMPHEEAEHIITQCANEYISQKHSGQP